MIRPSRVMSGIAAHDAERARSRATPNLCFHIELMLPQILTFTEQRPSCSIPEPEISFAGSTSGACRISALLRTRSQGALVRGTNPQRNVRGAANRLPHAD